MVRSRSAQIGRGNSCRSRRRRTRPLSDEWLLRSAEPGSRLQGRGVKYTSERALCISAWFSLLLLPLPTLHYTLPPVIESLARGVVRQRFAAAVMEWRAGRDHELRADHVRSRRADRQRLLALADHEHPARRQGAAQGLRQTGRVRPARRPPADPHLFRHPRLWLSPPPPR